MKVIHEGLVKRIVYIADNGSRFNSESECREYEEIQKTINRLYVQNPNRIFPYDDYIDTDAAAYFWIDIKTKEDIEAVRKCCDKHPHDIGLGLYCMEIPNILCSRMISINDSVTNAINLLEFAGYDTSTLKKKRE